ncbi:hypothetical protein [Weissella confusa]|uniref:hypothetical protein n=1 Tax=Weissella confusa TaxID=1583 RepID=UPI0018F1E042|nr:hypothetical protein [Weissella confusa]MBJ7691137.1 hypothetical protein [Weissella confusa]MBJ7701334.1 hypothetical protein [Weissella confusa]WEY48116.1 hypothetical protein P3T51_11370 [Weissella confusa]
MKKALLGSLVGVLVVGGGVAATAFMTQDNGGKTQSKAHESSVTKPLQDGKVSAKSSYSIPEKDLKSSSYVSSGAPSEVGEYTINQQGNKAELAAQSKVEDQLDNGSITYKVTSVKKMANTPATDEAVQMAQMALNTRDITGDYTTLIVRYSLTNNADKTVVTDGVTAAKFSDGSVVSVQGGGLDNDHTLVSGVEAGQTKDAFVVLLVPKSLAVSVNNVALQFATTYQDGQQLTGASDPLDVKF